MSETKIYKLITSIHKLKYFLFKEVLIEGNLSLLSEDPDASKELLAEAWDKILEQYSEAIASEDDKSYYSAYAEYLWLKCKYDKAEDYLFLLRKVYVAEWFKDLLKLAEKRLPAGFKIDPASEEYLALLDSCESRCRTNIKVRMDIAEVSLEALSQKRKEHSNSHKPSYESFARIENNLAIYFKIMQSDFDNISLFKYCDLCKRYTEEGKRLEKQHK